MQGQTGHHISYQEFHVLHALYCGVVDVEQSERGPFQPVVSHQFLGFIHIQEKVVVADQSCENLHDLPALALIAVPDQTHGCCIHGVLNGIHTKLCATIV